MNNSKLAPTSNAQVAAHLNKQGARQNQITAFEDQAKNWFSVNAKRIRSLMGSDEDARRLLIAAINSLQKIPTLAECTFESWAVCLLQSAEYRLFPGAMQQCAYVPFNNNKKGVKEATFILQYQGLCELLYRSGMIKDIECEIVCSKDLFEYKRGSNRALVFEPYDGDLAERGEWLGVYCVIRNIYGGEHIKYLTAKEINAFKARSRASGSSDSPWNSKHLSDIAWMWAKTALKQCAKLAPKSATAGGIIGAAMAADEPDIEQSSGAVSVTDFGRQQSLAPASAAALPDPTRHVIEGEVLEDWEKEADAMMAQEQAKAAAHTK